MKNTFEFKDEARKLYALIDQLSAAENLGGDFSSLKARLGMENKARILKKISAEPEKKTYCLKTKLLAKCKKDVEAFEPQDDTDRVLKKEIFKIILRLEKIEE